MGVLKPKMRLPMRWRSGRVSASSHLDGAGPLFDRTPIAPVFFDRSDHLCNQAVEERQALEIHRTCEVDLSRAGQQRSNVVQVCQASRPTGFIIAGVEHMDGKQRNRHGVEGVPMRLTKSTASGSQRPIRMALPSTTAA